MKITGNTPQITRPEPTKQVGGTTPTGPATKQQQPAARPAESRTDSVQISDAGRALAQEKVEKAGGEGLDPARANEIRQRILSGAYNSTAIVDQVARRILDKGDA